MHRQCCSAPNYSAINHWDKVNIFVNLLHVTTISSSFTKWNITYVKITYACFQKDQSKPSSFSLIFCAEIHLKNIFCNCSAFYKQFTPHVYQLRFERYSSFYISFKLVIFRCLKLTANYFTFNCKHIPPQRNRRRKYFLSFIVQLTSSWPISEQ